MKLFKLFRKKKEDVAAISQDENPDDAALLNPTAAPQAPTLSAFFEVNYEEKGFREGYLYPASENLEKALRLIQSNFRMELDKRIDFAQTEIYSLRLHLIDIRDISERIEESLREKVLQLEHLIQTLDQEKILSVEGEGKIAPALHAYRAGFIKGIEQFHKENFFISNP